MRSFIFCFSLITLIFFGSRTAQAALPPGGAGGYYGQCLPSYIAFSFNASRPLNGLPVKTPSYAQQFISTYSFGTVKLDVVVWREACQNSAFPATLVRVTTSGSGTRLGDLQDLDMRFTQSGITTSPLDLYPCSGLGNCGSSFLALNSFSDSTNTALIAVLRDERVNLANAFTLSFFGSGGSLNVPAYATTNSGPVALKGALSGNWFDPARNGEGFMFDIGTLGAQNVFFVAWFTHDQGRQRWLAGNAAFAESATSISVPLVIVQGTNFGNQFNPAQLVTTPWGNATFTFNSCNSLTVSYSGGGEQSTRNYQRLLTGGLKNVACP